MKTSASGALVMYRLLPLMTQSSPSRTAVVASPPGSEPASASVSAKDATHSPLASRGRNRLRCSSVPPSSSTWPAIPLLVPNIDRNAGLA